MLAINKSKSILPLRHVPNAHAEIKPNRICLHTPVPSLSSDDSKKSAWHNDVSADSASKTSLFIGVMSSEEAATQSFDKEYSEHNLAIISAMRDVLSNNAVENKESKKKVFYYLIQSLQDKNIYASTKDELVRVLKTLNDEKAFVGMDLSSLDFTGLVVQNLDLSGATMRNAILVSANFSHTKLPNADLTGSDLTYATMHYVNLNKANLTNVCTMGCQFVGATLYQADVPTITSYFKLSIWSQCKQMRARFANSRGNVE